MRPAALPTAILITACSVAAWADGPPLREVIDQQVQAVWQREKITPASASTDAEFLRRVYLDLLGTIPTCDEAVAFLDDTSTDKRQKLVDRLLEDPRYAQHQSDVWDMVLFGRDPPGYDAKKRDGFQRWLRGEFAQNKPWDKIVHQMLVAAGNTAEQGAPMYLIQYRRQPEDAAVAVTQNLLGVQLQCARCHDHPFDSWTQLDFYGMAAFFARLDVVSMGKVNDENKLVLAEKSIGDIQFTGPAAEAKAGKKGKPVAPKFLGGQSLEEPDVPKDFEQVKFQDKKAPPAPLFSRKNALADWAIAADNPYFARAAVNRVWAQFMGHGIVHPVDNLSPANPPSHPELLKALSEQFVAHQFDLKWLICELVNTKAYQLSSGGEPIEERPIYFERARFRPLSAEEMADAWRVATRYLQVAEKQNKKPKEGERFFGMTGDYMLRFFGTPANGVGDFQGGLHEHLYLNNGELSRLLETREGSLHHAILNSDQPWEDRVNTLFLCTLSRRPSDAERAKFVEYLTAEENPHERLKEAIWSLLVCSEFRFNH